MKIKVKDQVGEPINLHYKERLMYFQIFTPTQHDIERLPTVTLTSDKPWLPQMLDSIPKLGITLSKEATDKKRHYYWWSCTQVGHKQQRDCWVYDQGDYMVRGPGPPIPTPLTHQSVTSSTGFTPITRTLCHGYSLSSEGGNTQGFQWQHLYPDFCGHGIMLHFWSFAMLWVWRTSCTPRFFPLCWMSQETPQWLLQDTT